MKLTQIAKVLRVNIPQGIDADIQWLLTDSRSLSFPTETLFFALKSERNDGHHYVEELYERNLRYFVVSEISFDVAKMPDAVFLFVGDTLQALQQLATKKLTNPAKKHGNIPL